MLQNAIIYAINRYLIAVIAVFSKFLQLMQLDIT